MQGVNESEGPEGSYNFEDFARNNPAAVQSPTEYVNEKAPTGDPMKIAERFLKNNRELSNFVETDTPIKAMGGPSAGALANPHFKAMYDPKSRKAEGNVHDPDEDITKLFRPDEEKYNYNSDYEGSLYADRDVEQAGEENQRGVYSNDGLPSVIAKIEEGKVVWHYDPKFKQENVSDKAAYGAGNRDYGGENGTGYQSESSSQYEGNIDGVIASINDGYLVFTNPAYIKGTVYAFDIADYVPVSNEDDLEIRLSA